MINKGARFITGHFFLAGMFFLLLGASAGCGSEEGAGNRIMTLPETGAVTMVILFADSISGSQDSMPEGAVSLPLTASGYFYPSDYEETDVFRPLAEEAGSAGKLLMCILPAGENFMGYRDHLVININSRGIPESVEPEINSELLSDSLWEDPIVRQQTILELINFFKPDMVFQIVPESGNSLAITEFWSLHAASNDLSVALFTDPVSETRFRGWGAFTGRGIQNSLIEGMDTKGFATTIRMISGMTWYGPEQGYPAMQAFFAAENE